MSDSLDQPTEPLEWSMSMIHVLWARLDDDLLRPNQYPIIGIP